MRAWNVLVLAAKLYVELAVSALSIFQKKAKGFDPPPDK